jgi:hypothetical protein
VNADGTVIEFREVHDFVDGFNGIDVSGVGGIHVDGVGGYEMAGGVGGVAVVDAIVLDAEAADGDGHPTVLIAMIVDAAFLANFPADGHALEEIVFENEIASVVALGKIRVGVKRFGADEMVEDEIVNIFESEFGWGDSLKLFNPLVDGEFFGGKDGSHGRLHWRMAIQGTEGIA